MIPVKPQLEPPDFDEKLRQPGPTWLSKKNILLKSPPPDPDKLPAYWHKCQKALWDAYQGVCAYLCIYFEWSSGASSTDHFIAKSQHAGLAYEWSNYRLSCLGANRNKNRFDDVLDPFEIKPDTFVLNLSDGSIKPNPKLTAELNNRALETIKRLGLDSPEDKEMRARHYTDYLTQDVSANWLTRNSPFVWYEATRQGLL